MNGRALALLLLMLLIAGVAAGMRGVSPAVQTAAVHRESPSTGISDDELRRTIARAIYGHPTFWHTASLAEPPIDIVVQNGTVTLTGTVDGELERTLASSLARGHGETAVINLLRTRAAKFN